MEQKSIAYWLQILTKPRKRNERKVWRTLARKLIEGLRLFEKLADVKKRFSNEETKSIVRVNCQLYVDLQPDSSNAVSPMATIKYLIG